MERTSKTGQLYFFPYRFDVIPVELISAIYEQFVHSLASSSAGAKPARRKGVYYTPLAAVSLVLDEVFDGLTGGERVLDLHVRIGRLSRRGPAQAGVPQDPGQIAES